jgi:hypothetical protein
MITTVKDDSMENKSRERMIFLGTVAIAVIFLTSIASFSFNSNRNTSTTTTIFNVQTLLGIGYSNATVTGYVQKFTLSLSNTSSNSTAIELSAILNKLSLNGSISDFIPAGDSFIVYAGNMSAYNVYNLINSNALLEGAFGINTTVRAQLPNTIVLGSNGQQVLPTNLPAGTTYSFPSNSPQSLGTLIPVKVQAYVYQNQTTPGTYSVYENNLVVYPR